MPPIRSVVIHGYRWASLLDYVSWQLSHVADALKTGNEYTADIYLANLQQYAPALSDEDRECLCQQLDRLCVHGYTIPKNETFGKL